MPKRVPTAHTTTPRPTATRPTLLFLLVCGVACASLPAASQTLLTTIPTGSHPWALAHDAANHRLYVANRDRVLDTRKSSGAFNGELTVNVVGSSCGVPASAQAYVFNAAVVPQVSLGYLTLWPDGQPRPLASTLNALDGAITSNMAIVPTSNGYIDAYASGLTQLVLDISSYFAP